MKTIEIVLLAVVAVMASIYIIFGLWVFRNIQKENKKQAQMAEEGRQYWVEIANQFYKEEEENK